MPTSRSLGGGGAQVWGVGAPEGVKASAVDAVVKVLIYSCQRGYRAMK